MKTYLAIFGAAIIVAVLGFDSEAVAQCQTCETGAVSACNNCGGGFGFANRHQSCGERAAAVHAWNQRMAAQTSWHANYNNWRWGAPAALVVPPTAAFQTSYGWGVGQTRSLPIYHQYGRNPAAAMSAGGGAYANTPYWPSNTQQFGIYPVRGPWQ